MEFSKIAELINLTFIDSKKYSDQAVYNQTVRLLGSTEAASNFLTSEKGGYSKTQLKKFIRNSI